MKQNTIRNLVLWILWIIVMTVTAGLPRGVLPNSIKPWIGPLPFSLAWLILLYLAGFGILLLSYKEVSVDTSESSISKGS